MGLSESFLLALIIIFSVPYLLWRALRLEACAPLAIVQIVGGVVLGPGILGALFPAWHQAVFNPQTLVALNGIASWAVMLFVFLAGVELDLADAWRSRRDTGLTAGLALVVPFVFGAMVGAVLLQQSAGWMGAKGNAAQFVFGVGMACAVTALPILVLLLERLEILRTDFGQRVLRYASLDDVAIWAVLAAILLDWERLGRQALFLIAVIPISLALRKLMARLNEADRWFILPIWVALTGFSADWAGLHFMVGAFIAGVVCERRWFALERLDQFRNAQLLAFMPVFFLSTGLRTRWEMGGTTVLLATVALLVAATGGKLLGVRMAGRWLGWRKGESYAIGWLLQTKALIMIIFVNILLDREIISPSLFTALLLMAVFSTVLTIPMVRKRLALLAL
jgi:Kef-type K+ transport system membrane component KefB